jgi:phytoene desaturase
MSIKKIAIIGSGFSGLSASCYLAKMGYDVTIFEKNEQIGGRARMFEADGFKFDMGPSWYWMPDVFENFFKDFGKQVSDYYKLEKLNPGFQVIFSKDDTVAINAEFSNIVSKFESIEKGSGKNLEKFIANAEYKYKISMSDLVFKPSHSFLEFIHWDIIKQVFKTNLFSPLSREVRRLFNDKRLIQIMEFPVIFLGAMADKIPALYSIMNYSALKQGTFYPQGGMVKIVEGMEKLALFLGVKIHTNSEVEKIIVKNKLTNGLAVNGKIYEFDAIISAADYHHTEMNLLDKRFRNYDEIYWEKKVFAPSSILFYLGINKKIKKLIHHNLFFDTDFKAHADAIYTEPKWVENPLFYVCAPSKTDSDVAPSDSENIFILIPSAIELDVEESRINTYFDNVIARLENYCGESIKDHIVYRKNFSRENFIQEYNSFKGNAYGLANTLLQTAFLKPKMQNKKIKNLMYTGQLTVPGPGVPPSLISGKIVATEMHKYLKNN